MCHEPTNEDRAEWAQIGLNAFAHQTGQGDGNDDPDTIISDFLADLMHLCQQEKIDFHVCLARAQGHYTEERAEERAKKRAKKRTH